MERGREGGREGGRERVMVREKVSMDNTRDNPRVERGEKEVQGDNPREKDEYGSHIPSVVRSSIAHCQFVVTNYYRQQNLKTSL